MLDKNRYQKQYQQQVPSSSNKHHQHSFQSHQSHQHPNSHYKAFSNHSNENYDIPGSTYFGPSSSGGNRYSRRESGSFGDGNKDKDRVAIPHGSRDLNVNGNRENAKSRFNSTTFPHRSARNHTSRHVEKAIRVNPFPVHTSLSPFDLGSQVGEGTYGQVFKALCKSTGKFVALKKLYLKEDDKGKEKNRDGFPITGIREIEILRSLNHQCIVKLEAMVSCSTGPDNLDMFMVFEYMDHDLTGILNNSAAVYTVPHIKCLSQQLFEGLAYLHSQNIIHRDVKGANLLLNKEGYLKIADFGLARRLHVDRDTGIPLEGFEYTNRVVTLWYRSPELLYGSTSYGFEVDIWSAGCIIMEFYTKWALFQGRTEIDQLELIFKLCGTPTEETWPEAKDLPWYGILKFPACERILVNEFKGPAYSLAPDFVDLIDQLLTLNPANRPTADQALAHEFFSNEPQPCKRNELPVIEGDWHEYEGKMRRKNKTQPISANAPPPLPLSDLSSQSKLSKKNQSLQNEGEVVSTEDINHQDTYSNRANDREAFHGKESFRSHNSRSRSPPKDSSYRYRGIDAGSRYRDRGGWNRDPYYKSRSPSPASNWKSQNHTADGKSHGRKRSTSPKDDREEKSRTSFSGRSGSPLSKRPRRSVSPNPARSSSFNGRNPPPLVKSEIWRQYHSSILRGAR